MQNRRENMVLNMAERKYGWFWAKNRKGKS